jgi:hypothetical protein
MKTKLLLIGVVLAFAMSGCTMTINPDGSRTYGIDAKQAIEIFRPQ